MAIYGPFYRVKTPTQTDEDIEKQLSSKEVWGKAPRGSEIPKVKAYTKEWIDIYSQSTGIVFWTNIPPDDTGSEKTGKVYWSGDREGVRIEGEYAKIKVTAIKRHP